MELPIMKDIEPLSYEAQVSGVRVGTVVRVEPSGEISVDFPDNPFGPVPARIGKSVKPKELRRVQDSNGEILLVFENNDPRRPIIIDTLSSEVDDTAEQLVVELNPGKPRDVRVDGRSITFNAQDEIILRCGLASIKLTRTGHIVIRGTYLLSRSSGANRIKGGSVQIN